MAKRIETLKEKIDARFAGMLSSSLDLGELTLVVEPGRLLEVCTALRDEEDFLFKQLIDVCGVDYLTYGKNEWETSEASAHGFSRGVDASTAGRLRFLEEDLSTIQPAGVPNRFAAVYHLLSLKNNLRLRIRCFAPDDGLPVVPSVIGIWSGANWFEREAFDLYGIIFEGHPDLRRILTDYGFIGHPFRKDFPLSGNVEVRYDPERQRVIYEPVSIEPRVLVPKVIRKEVHRRNEEAEPESDVEDEAP